MKQIGENVPQAVLLLKNVPRPVLTPKQGSSPFSAEGEGNFCPFWDSSSFFSGYDWLERFYMFLDLWKAFYRPENTEIPVQIAKICLKNGKIQGKPPKPKIEPTTVRDSLLAHGKPCQIGFSPLCWALSHRPPHHSALCEFSLTGTSERHWSRWAVNGAQRARDRPCTAQYYFYFKGLFLIILIYFFMLLTASALILQEM